MSRKSLITMLVGANLLLLSVLIVAHTEPKKAHAQVAPAAQKYVMVAGEINDGADALYIIDLSRRALHVFVPNRVMNDRRMIYAGARDLARDFRGGR